MHINKATSSDLFIVLSKYLMIIMCCLGTAPGQLFIRKIVFIDASTYILQCTRTERREIFMKVATYNQSITKILLRPSDFMMMIISSQRDVTSII